jgi:hypothetical protein
MSEEDVIINIEVNNDSANAALGKTQEKVKNIGTEAEHTGQTHGDVFERIEHHVQHVIAAYILYEGAIKTVESTLESLKIAAEETSEIDISQSMKDAAVLAQTAIIDLEKEWENYKVTSAAALAPAIQLIAHDLKDALVGAEGDVTKNTEKSELLAEAWGVVKTVVAVVADTFQILFQGLRITLTFFMSAVGLIATGLGTIVSVLNKDLGNAIKNVGTTIRNSAEEMRGDALGKWAQAGKDLGKALSGGISEETQKSFATIKAQTHEMAEEARRAAEQKKVVDDTAKESIDKRIEAQKELMILESMTIAQGQTNYTVDLQKIKNSVSLTEQYARQIENAKSLIDLTIKHGEEEEQTARLIARGDSTEDEADRKKIDNLKDQINAEKKLQDSKSFSYDVNLAMIGAYQREFAAIQKNIDAEKSEIENIKELQKIETDSTMLTLYRVKLDYINKNIDKEREQQKAIVATKDIAEKANNEYRADVTGSAVAVKELKTSLIAVQKTAGETTMDDAEKKRLVDYRKADDIVKEINIDIEKQIKLYGALASGGTIHQKIEEKKTKIEESDLSPGAKKQALDQIAAIEKSYWDKHDKGLEAEDEKEEKRLNEELERYKQQLLDTEDMTEEEMQKVIDIEDQMNHKKDKSQNQFNVDQKRKEQQDIKANTQLWESGWQGKIAIADQYLGNLATLMDSKNKTIFEIGKAAAIAKNVVDTISSAGSAFKYGTDIGGPALGAAFAATAVAAGMVRAQQLMAATPSGGGGGGLSSGGGGDTTNTMVNGGSNSNATPSGNVNISLHGSMYSANDIRNLITAINSQAANGQTLKIT